MSGHSGFAPIGNNNPVVQMPPVGGVGNNSGQRAALKAYLITLDLRDEALDASEAALRAKAEEIRPAAIIYRRV